MPLESTALAGLMYADYAAAIPTANAAIRANPSAGILPHNVPFEMVSAISTGLISAILASTISDTYTGVVGTTAQATPVPPFFNPGVVSGATTTFLGSMAWAGTASGIVATTLISSPFVHITSKMVLQMNPIPGAGPGGGVVSPVVNAGVPAAFTALCQSAMTSGFLASGKFNAEDLPLGPLSPKITLLVTNLSIAYGTIVGAVTANTAYVGASSGTGPLSAVNVGKFV